MKISKLKVENFRLLKDIDLSLENKVTVIVGRNNSGKTSLTEIFRRLAADSLPSFLLEDFSLSCHDEFWEAFKLYSDGAEENIIRAKIPKIDVKVHFEYDINSSSLGPISDFIIDLSPVSSVAIANLRYQLKDGSIANFFSDCQYDKEQDIDLQRNTFFKLMKERIPRLFSSSLFAVDPTDSTNEKRLEMSNLKNVMMTGFINAQRGMDDTTHKDNDVLGRILEKLLTAAGSDYASTTEKEKAREIDSVVKGIQQKIDSDFNHRLAKLLPALQGFGYPGLSDPHLRTETILDVQRLLGNHTKLKYLGANGIGLPEAYNGLGSRNLIFILFQLYEFFKSFQTKEPIPGAHLIFIEEPEAHLHPQMQEVFIEKICEIAKAFSAELGNGKIWPVQVIVTTHSTHMANEAPFESIRYFLHSKMPSPKTRIKDLKKDFCETPSGEDKEFLHKFLTLTRCDLFFADKAILIEGTTERLMMPKMIEKTDANLAGQYIAIIEVGGAFVHRFFKLLDFLEIQTLIITDLDSVKQNTNGARRNWIACKVSEGLKTSNTGIKKWFGDDDVTPSTLIAANTDSKTVSNRHIAFQVPENEHAVCGRSFEAAFMLANESIFKIDSSVTNKEEFVWNETQEIKKSDFALQYGIHELNWTVPKYIQDGLLWLSANRDFSPNTTSETRDR